MIDFADLIGQEHVRRALEVATAGGHSILLTGSAGSGKTTLLTAALGLLPDPSDGVLVDADRFPRFPPAAMAVGEPLMLLCEMMPCLCGWYGDPERPCTCSSEAVVRYQRRLPTKLREQIAIFCDVPTIPYDVLTRQRRSEPTRAIRERVLAARERAAARLRPHGMQLNAELPPAAITATCALDAAGQALMQAAHRQLQMTVGQYMRTLTVARTIADLANATQIGAPHLAEAFQYRPRRRD